MALRDTEEREAGALRVLARNFRAGEGNRLCRRTRILSPHSPASTQLSPTNSTPTRLAQHHLHPCSIVSNTSKSPPPVTSICSRKKRARVWSGRVQPSLRGTTRGAPANNLMIYNGRCRTHKISRFIDMLDHLMQL
ncbi:hypothetical protein E2C01_026398 [Portunus trituberculatus]|uniref:Uncharacterized protein n=1 Tax=Portunus trituberculatus TaxID=210409 RepID=A0A5B7EFB5_PORTR|nr:hypothetical protein [Portunus trituberculatus]